MLSPKLLHLIETHGDRITRAIVSSIRRNPELPTLAQLPDVELRERSEKILNNLGHWLTQGNDEKLALEYDSIGKIRFEESVPLEECIRGICTIKYEMLAFLDAQGMDPDYLALYAEEQLIRKAGPFFDSLILHLVRGYEHARRRAAYAG
jgi:hypothetical protein